MSGGGFNTTTSNPRFGGYGGNSNLIGYRGNPLQSGSPNPYTTQGPPMGQPGYQNPYTTQGPAMTTGGGQPMNPAARGGMMTGGGQPMQGAGRGYQPQGFGPLPPGSTQGNSGPMDQFSTDAWNSPTMGQSTNAAPPVSPEAWNGLDNLTLSGRGTRSFVYDPATMGTDPRFQWGAVGQTVGQTRGQQAQMQLLDSNGNLVSQGGGFGRVGAFGTSGLTPGQTYNLMYDLPTTGAWNLIGNGGVKGPTGPAPGTQSLQALLSGPRRYT